MSLGHNGVSLAADGGPTLYGFIHDMGACNFLMAPVQMGNNLRHSADIGNI